MLKVTLCCLSWDRRFLGPSCNVITMLGQDFCSTKVNPNSFWLQTIHFFHSFLSVSNSFTQKIKSTKNAHCTIHLINNIQYISLDFISFHQTSIHQNNPPHIDLGCPFWVIFSSASTPAHLMGSDLHTLHIPGWRCTLPTTPSDQRHHETFSLCRTWLHAVTVWGAPSNKVKARSSHHCWQIPWTLPLSPNLQFFPIDVQTLILSNLGVKGVEVPRATIRPNRKLCRSTINHLPKPHLAVGAAEARQEPLNHTEVQVVFGCCSCAKSNLFSTSFHILFPKILWSWHEVPNNVSIKALDLGYVTYGFITHSPMPRLPE